ncbi:hypothetical protein GCM10010106_14850 [Thermopolyspora flexuosa]|uniref:Monosaccharide ABC transporter substrate-binding protein (CUT2 family) n=1 Tax=Thermopolyspora flexuosa TaxID=103836 RepID=A0A543IPR6_9ACTN|nr:sugar ABC transporter substrate-binding protein [Thermopolyspora flexuosa]TQM72549.1 monosaccharide ABC transporter substrate-binding protein (CUT2 family) [Thermopolyspora flexuosa]GGM69702.1 hypothetical protein GCM10010106_14850 [Thermopolyspora flexuosa]
MVRTSGSFLRRSFKAIAGIAAASLLLTACGGDTGSGGGTAGAAPADDRFASLKTEIDALRGPITWPEPKKLSNPVDLTGKTVWWVPIGAQVSVINGFGEGVKQAVTALGGEVKLCDGKFNPAEIGNCLKQAGEQKADAVITAFIDYAMIPNAFDALVAQGVPVLVAGVPPTGDPKPSPNFAFFDPTGQVMKIYETITKVGLIENGSNTKGLWLRLLDSQLTTRASDAGVAKYKELCPDCPLATIDYTTANIDKLPSAISAELVKNPDINAVFVPVANFVQPVLQGIKTAGKTGIKVVSANGDLQNLQAIAGGEQTGDLSTPVIFNGWQYVHALLQLLAGEQVEPVSDLTNRYFDATNIKDLTLTPEKYLTTEWFGDESFKDAFLAAWGAGQ